jgi:hypothetical protein
MLLEIAPPNSNRIPDGTHHFLAMHKCVKDVAGHKTRNEGAPDEHREVRLNKVVCVCL